MPKDDRCRLLIPPAFLPFVRFPVKPPVSSYHASRRYTCIDITVRPSSHFFFRAPLTANFLRGSHNSCAREARCSCHELVMPPLILTCHFVINRPVISCRCKLCNNEDDRNMFLVCIGAPARYNYGEISKAIARKFSELALSCFDSSRINLRNKAATAGIQLFAAF